MHAFLFCWDGYSFGNRLQQCYLAFKNVLRGLESGPFMSSEKGRAQFWNSQLPAISTPRHRWADHHLMDLYRLATIQEFAIVRLRQEQEGYVPPAARLW